jgi:hypothetical protein
LQRETRKRNDRESESEREGKRESERVSESERKGKRKVSEKAKAKVKGKGEETVAKMCISQPEATQIQFCPVATT